MPCLQETHVNDSTQKRHGKEMIPDHKISMCTQKIAGEVTENNPWEFGAVVPLTGSLNRTFFTSSFRALADLGNLTVLLCDACF